MKQNPERRALVLQVRKWVLTILGKLPEVIDPVSVTEQCEGLEVTLIVGPENATASATLPAAFSQLFFSPLERLIVEKLGDKPVKQIMIARAVGMVEASDERKAKIELRMVLNNLVSRGIVEADEDGYRLAEAFRGIAHHWFDKPPKSASDATGKPKQANGPS
jgi:hypothetical protein